VRILQENHCNIKITYQDDLEICRGLLAMRR
jgi:2-C-methyl-D-erythritol 4-phosphate cytidylyltransferase